MPPAGKIRQKIRRQGDGGLARLGALRIAFCRAIQKRRPTFLPQGKNAGRRLVVTR